MELLTDSRIEPDAWTDLCSRPQYYRASLDGITYDIRAIWRVLRRGDVQAEMLWADVAALFPLVPEAVSDLSHCMRVRAAQPLLGVEWVSPEGTVEVRMVDGWHRIGRRLLELHRDPARVQRDPDATCMTTCLLKLDCVGQFIVIDTNKAMHRDLCTDTDTQAFMAGVCATHGVDMPAYFRLSQLMAEGDYATARQYVSERPALRRMIEKLDIAA